LDDPVLLSEIPNRTARARAAEGAPVVVFLNPVEYHGPHLPLDTDTILAEGALREAYSVLRGQGLDWPMLVYSKIRVGCGAVPTNGSIRHRYREMKRVVRDVCGGIRSLGAKRAILMTFHGEPHHNLAIEDGVRLLRSRGIAAMAPMNVVMTESVELSLETYDPIFSTIPDEGDRKSCRAEFSDDFHAGFLETSLMLRWRPEAVDPRWRGLPDCPSIGRSGAFPAAARLLRSAGLEKLSREVEFAHVGIQWGKLRPFPGYSGKPRLANSEAGRLFAERTGLLLARAIRGYFLESIPPPEPIFKWVRALSLGGRIG
jgi:creatinine amidohydrolase